MEREKLLRRAMLIAYYCLFGVLIAGISVPLLAQRPELLYLRFNEGAGVSTTDFAIPGISGTAPLMNALVSWDSVDPKLGASCLDATTSTGPIPTCSTTAGINYNGDWTIEVWLKRTGYHGSVLFGKDSILSPWIVDLGNGVFDRMILEATNRESILANQIGAISTWQHLAIVHDSVNMTLTSFVDGVSQGTVAQIGRVRLQGIAGFLIGGDGTAPWQGLIDEFRIWQRVLNEQEIQGGMFTEANAKLDDVAVIKIISPSQPPKQNPYVPLSAAETVKVRISNLGSNTLAAGTILPLSIVLDGVVQTTESFAISNALQTGETASYTFTSTVDLAQQGHQRLEIVVAMVGDLQPLNDTRERIFRGTQSAFVAQFPYTEDFDAVGPGSNAPIGWSQEANDNAAPFSYGDWLFLNEANGPVYFDVGDHTFGGARGGNFAFLGGLNSVATGITISMLSPIFDLNGMSNARFDFWLNSVNLSGQQDSTLSVDVIDWPSGNTLLDVYGPQGALSTTSPAWNRQFIDLNPFVMQKIMLRFRGVTSNVQDAHYLICDDLRLVDHLIGAGQAPQPGLAVLDINSCRNIGNELVSFLEPGPYFASSIIGETLEIRLEGESNQPVILFFGNYGVASATFPNIGQMDVGGNVNPMTGIPTGISVLFDGNSPTGLNPLFITDVTGVSGLITTTPLLPIGLLTTFQGAMYNSTSGISLTNAVLLEIE